MKILTVIIGIILMVQGCLTNLTLAGKLKKLGQMVESKFGKQVHTWALNR